MPAFALEIVAQNCEKAYSEAPARYAATGVSGLVIFDPEPSRHAEGVAWQVFRRVRNRALTLVEVSRADRIRSKVLGCYLRAVGAAGALRVRRGTGTQGDDRFPTGEEAERIAKEAALKRVKELEAALAERGPRRKR